MNRSYSKIRHIQESNILIEQRRLGLIKEQDSAGDDDDDIMVGGLFGSYKNWIEKNGYNIIGNWFGGGLFQDPVNETGLINSDYIYIISKKDRKTIKKIKTVDFNNQKIKNIDKVNPNSKYWILVSTPEETKLAMDNATRGGLDNLGRMKASPTPENIAEVLRKSTHWVNDKEADAETAFMMINNKDTYFKVKNLLGKSPYEFVKTFMNTSKVYNSGSKAQSIDASMKRLGFQV